MAGHRGVEELAQLENWPETEIGNHRKRHRLVHYTDRQNIPNEMFFVIFDEYWKDEVPKTGLFCRIHYFFYRFLMFLPSPDPTGSSIPCICTWCAIQQSRQKKDRVGDIGPKDNVMLNGPIARGVGVRR